MEPRILISSAADLPGIAVNYENAIRAGGGVPVVRYCPEADLSFDGLLLTGGGDVAPCHYGMDDRGSMPPDLNRDRAELALVKAYLDAGRPILGICRGAQVLNVALGGSLVQDLGPLGNEVHRKTGPDDKVHLIRAQAGSILHALYGHIFRVNSAHHQAVDRPGTGLSVTARSECGVVEAMELPGKPVLALQFHPERMTGLKTRPDTVDGSAIFRWFLAQTSR